eukprot:m.1010562 g.1010562  ORF g.1010562 m.1010562 type:complete len:468 (-) comp24060_c0_seq3:3391-4794(-)
MPSVVQTLRALFVGAGCVVIFMTLFRTSKSFGHTDTPMLHSAHDVAHETESQSTQSASIESHSLLTTEIHIETSETLARRQYTKAISFLENLERKSNSSGHQEFQLNLCSRSLKTRERSPSTTVQAHLVDQHGAMPLKVLPFHVVFPVAYDEYDKESANRLARGNSKATPDWMDGLFEEVPKLSQADAIIYIGNGDDSSINDDVMIARRLSICIPIVFWITSDEAYYPAECPPTTAVNMIFFAVNMSKVTNCTVYPIPYGVGAALGNEKISAVPFKEFEPLLLQTYYDEKRFVAVFIGSEKTYQSRSLLKIMNETESISVEFTDWWNDTMTAEDHQNLAQHARSMLQTSTFALCPRGHGYSSMRFTEAVAHGAIPVLLDDWTMPFGDDITSFAIRWPLQLGDAAGARVLADTLVAMAHDPHEIARRRKHMLHFIEQWHPIWFSCRFLHSKLHPRPRECRPHLDRMMA